MGCRPSKADTEEEVEPSPSSWTITEESDKEGSDEDADVDIHDEEPIDGLCPVVLNALTQLKQKHKKHQDTSWGLSHGRVVEILQTPPTKFWSDEITNDDQTTHSDHFADAFGDVMALGEEFVDFASLGVPDGKFLDSVARGLRALHDKGLPIKVRLMTGNIVGLPTDDTGFLKSLVSHAKYGLPDDTQLQIWVGSWRKGLSWNHAKIVAVDGKYLVQGGHNAWDGHYLKQDPVRDVSARYTGKVAADGHVFLNRMWAFINKRTQAKRAVRGMAAFVPKFSNQNISLLTYPSKTPEYPPAYQSTSSSLTPAEAIERGDMPMLTLGRYGGIHLQKQSANPADTAIVAMFEAAQSTIKLSLQDLGPVAVPGPGGPRCVPGTRWPIDSHPGYLDALARAIVHRHVNVHIAVSAPNCVPFHLSQFEANYGNGWSWRDVASEIIKAVKKHAGKIRTSGTDGLTSTEVNELIRMNLRVVYMKAKGGKHDWHRKLSAGEGVGNHSKVFMVDDMCYYIGSQNLYIADLAEWGIVVDSQEACQKFLHEYWNPMWKASNKGDTEGDIEGCIDDAEKDRNSCARGDLTEEQYEDVLHRMKAARMGGSDKQLLVWVMQAKNLREADLIGQADPYVILHVEDAHCKRVTNSYTSQAIMSGGHSPLWNEQFLFEGLERPEELFLHIRIFDRDTFMGIDAFGRDDFLGDAKIPLNEIIKSNRFQERTVAVWERGYKGQQSTVRLALNPHNGWGTTETE